MKESTTISQRIPIFPKKSVDIDMYIILISNNSWGGLIFLLCDLLIILCLFICVIFLQETEENCSKEVLIGIYSKPSIFDRPQSSGVWSISATNRGFCS